MSTSIHESCYRQWQMPGIHAPSCRNESFCAYSAPIQSSIRFHVGMLVLLVSTSAAPPPPSLSLPSLLLCIVLPFNLFRCLLLLLLLYLIFIPLLPLSSPAPWLSSCPASFVSMSLLSSYSKRDPLSLMPWRTWETLRRAIVISTHECLGNLRETNITHATQKRAREQAQRMSGEKFPSRSSNESDHCNEDKWSRIWFVSSSGIHFHRYFMSIVLLCAIVSCRFVRL